MDVAQRFQMTEHDLTGIEIRAKVQYALRRGSRTTQIAVANATLRAKEVSSRWPCLGSALAAKAAFRRQGNIVSRFVVGRSVRIDRARTGRRLRQAARQPAAKILRGKRRAHVIALRAIAAECA